MSFCIQSDEQKYFFIKNLSKQKSIYRICYNIGNTTGVTCGARPAYLYGAVTPRLWWGSCCFDFNFLCWFFRTFICRFVF